MTDTIENANNVPGGGLFLNLWRNITHNLPPAIPWSKISGMKAILEARKRLLGVAAIFLLVLLMMNLNSRLGEYFRLDTERDKLATQVSDLKLTRVALETQVTYATSDQAVEEWARGEAHLSQPGDQVVIVVTPVNNTLVPQVVETPAPRPVQNWEVWWALFFGK
jgi:cell division protein FtsB